MEQPVLRWSLAARLMIQSLIADCASPLGSVCEHKRARRVLPAQVQGRRAVARSRTTAAQPSFQRLAEKVYRGLAVLFAVQLILIGVFAALSVLLNVIRPDHRFDAFMR